jgi:predicted nucleic acid-binding protein
LALTAVADTRLLLSHEFPPDEETREKISILLRAELSSRLLAPSIVLSEFIKIAGARMGEEASRVRIAQLKERGMRVVAVGERHALSAGKLMLAHHETPMADAIVASFVATGDARYVISDDPHYRALGVKSKWV